MNQPFYSTIFLSHGGGPRPLLGDPDHQQMVSQLRQLARQSQKPDVIVLVSAHWEANNFKVMSQSQPELLYDYYGFPPQAYTITYPAPGDPALANTLITALAGQGIAAEEETRRGFDHGMFVPLSVMYPDADIPVVQVSLHQSLDAARHIKLGKALAGCLPYGAQLIGSGFSFHNMASFKRSSQDEHNMNREFQNWLADVVCLGNLTDEARGNKLEQWKLAPYARYCHPREEHLIPLHTCYGREWRKADGCFQSRILNKLATTFVWER